MKTPQGLGVVPAIVEQERIELDAATGLALGLLCTARYVLPAIGGLPFVASYLPALKKMDKGSLAAARVEPAARP